jgi:hypothetical protein
MESSVDSAPSLVIDPTDGSVHIDGLELVIDAGLTQATALVGLSRFYVSTLDMKTGYEWLKFRGVKFGGERARFAPCFYVGKLTEIGLGASSPNEKMTGRWPSREEMDENVAFLRQELRRQLHRPFWTGEERFEWGGVWANIDVKGGLPSAGLRYGPRIPRITIPASFGK